MLGGHLLVTLDGTQYFSSAKIHCEHCSTRQHKNGSVTYYHSGILPVIVAPGQSQVSNLAKRDEEILFQEVSPLHGWSINPSDL